MTAEFRSPSDETRRNAGDALRHFAQELAGQQNLKIEATMIYSQMA